MFLCVSYLLMTWPSQWCTAVRTARWSVVVEEEGSGRTTTRRGQRPSRRASRAVMAVSSLVRKKESRFRVFYFLYKQFFRLLCFDDGCDSDIDGNKTKKCLTGKQSENVCTGRMTREWAVRNRQKDFLEGETTTTWPSAGVWSVWESERQREQRGGKWMKKKKR